MKTNPQKCYLATSGWTNTLCIYIETVLVEPYIAIVLWIFSIHPLKLQFNFWKRTNLDYYSKRIAIRWFHSFTIAHGKFQTSFSDRIELLKLTVNLNYSSTFSNILWFSVFFVQNKLTRKQQIKLDFKKFPVWDCFRRGSFWIISLKAKENLKQHLIWGFKRRMKTARERFRKLCFDVIYCSKLAKKNCLSSRKLCKLMMNDHFGSLKQA